MKTAILLGAMLVIGFAAVVPTAAAHPACAGEVECGDCTDDGRTHVHWGSDHAIPCATVGDGGKVDWKAIIVSLP